MMAPESQLHMPSTSSLHLSHVCTRPHQALVPPTHLLHLLHHQAVTLLHQVQPRQPLALGAPGCGQAEAVGRSSGTRLGASWVPAAAAPACSRQAGWLTGRQAQAGARGLAGRESAQRPWAPPTRGDLLHQLNQAHLVHLRQRRCQPGREGISIISVARRPPTPPPGRHHKPGRRRRGCVGGTAQRSTPGMTRCPAQHRQGTVAQRPAGARLVGGAGGLQLVTGLAPGLLGQQLADLRGSGATASSPSGRVRHQSRRAGSRQGGDRASGCSGRRAQASQLAPWWWGHATAPLQL